MVIEYNLITSNPEILGGISVKLALVILQAPDNPFETLSPLVPQILAALRQLPPGTSYEL